MNFIDFTKKAMNAFLIVEGVTQAIRAYISPKARNKFKVACKTQHAHYVHEGRSIQLQPVQCNKLQSQPPQIVLNVISAPCQGPDGQSYFYCARPQEKTLNIQAGSHHYNAQHYWECEQVTPRFKQFIDGGLAPDTYHENRGLVISGYGELGTQLMKQRPRTVILNEREYIVQAASCGIKDNCNEWQLKLKALKTE